MHTYHEYPLSVYLPQDSISSDHTLFHAYSHNLKPIYIVLYSSVENICHPSYFFLKVRVLDKMCYASFDLTFSEFRPIIHTFDCLSLVPYSDRNISTGCCFMSFFPGEPSF